MRQPMEGDPLTLFRGQLGRHEEGIDGLRREIAEVKRLVMSLAKQGAKIMATLDEILQDVQQESDADDSIIALLENIKKALDAAGQDQAKLDQVKQLIDTNKAKIAAAVTANTPAAATS